METKDIEQAIAEAKREYYRKWREKNKDKIKENNRRYWERKAMQKLTQEKEVSNNG